MNICFEVVADILEHRHLSNYKDKYDFIQDTLIINFDEASDETISRLNLEVIKAVQ